MNNLENIAAAISAFRRGNFRENALKFFDILGYQSERTLDLSLTAFFPHLDQQKALVDYWKNNAILFQLTDENLEGIQSLITAVDNTIIQSYLFVAIELIQNLSKKNIIQITRELNKHSLQPILILFVESSQLTLSIIHRRLNKQNEQKDVLEKVTLLKDIRISNPHRAHLEILNDLTLSNLTPIPHNFVELHQRWQRVLDTKELNKKFYKELSQWYFWAIKQVHFPNPENIELNQYHAQSLIRLLTRLLFVWFVKEKQLIPEQLFEEKYLNTLLETNDQSRYYKAILQNLFFATLNQTQGNREFRKNKQNMNVTNLMRYQRYFKKSEEFLALVESIVPFMNGGLFECLDKPLPDKKGKQGGDVIAYYDGFSDREDNVLKVPDFIFFGEHKNIDLSNELGTKHKSVQIKGLIDIFNRYKFTVTENTPLEEDVALDPELLGQVFENLLASYNPETGTTARKQTGSFYTPREIVDYMVDESLIAYLNSNLQGFENLAGLRTLLNYSTEENLFNSEETLQLIEAIDQCKILDPACGSGAFPMGVLHKLVHCLHILDPKNKQWKERQIQKAHFIDDDKIREQLINDIEEAFNNNELDYGRKLYLIENGIYGVDIQTIAIQISKLRFFISLMVDQQIDPKKDNFGVRPLPNLETKFVAANTLIGIEKPKAQFSLLSNKDIEQLEQKLKDIRHRIFSSKTPKTKRELREQDKNLREQIGKLLEKHGLEHQTAVQLAQWNPYDQNMSSPFFNPEWMFGVSNGFDIVIGNPPYVGHKGGQKELFNTLRKSELGMRFNNERMDLFYYFFHIGLDILKTEGIISFITTNYFATADSALKLRKDFKQRSTVLQFFNFNELKLFESATGQHSLISILKKGINPSVLCKIFTIETDEIFNTEKLNEIFSKVDHNYSCNFIENSKLFEGDMLYLSCINSTGKDFSKIENILEKLKHNTTVLGDLCNISQGIVTGADKISPKHIKKEIIDQSFLGKGCFILNQKEYINLYTDRELFKPWFKNSAIRKYHVDEINNEWLIYATTDVNIEQYQKVYEHLLNLKSVIEERNYDSGELSKAKKLNKWWALSSSRKDFDFTKPKIVSPQRSYTNTFGYSETSWYASADVYFITKPKSNYSLKFLLAVLNSKIIYKWLYYLGKRKGEMLELYQEPLSKIPIPQVSLEQQQPLIELVDKILLDKKAGIDTKELEEKIDQLVYKLYGLSEEEIKIVEGKNN